MYLDINYIQNIVKSIYLKKQKISYNLELMEYCIFQIVSHSGSFRHNAFLDEYQKLYTYKS